MKPPPQLSPSAVTTKLRQGRCKFSGFKLIVKSGRPEKDVPQTRETVRRMHWPNFIRGHSYRHLVLSDIDTIENLLKISFLCRLRVGLVTGEKVRLSVSLAAGLLVLCKDMKKIGSRPEMILLARPQSREVAIM